MEAAERLDLLSRLADAYSTQLRAAHRIWLALAALSAVSVLATGNGDAAKLPLPFGFGEAEPWIFYSVMLALVAVTTLAFASSYTHAIRSRILIQRALDVLRKAGPLPGNIDIQDAFDILHVPGLNRIAPLAQHLLGRWQFFPQAAHRPRPLGILSAIYYVVLRVVAHLVYLGLPASAMLMMFDRCRASSPRWAWFPLAALTAIAGVALVQLICEETHFTRRVVQRITSDRDRSPTHDSQGADNDGGAA